MIIERTQSENICIVNVHPNIYIIPQKRPYVHPSQRTDQENKLYQIMNKTFFAKKGGL